MTALAQAGLTREGEGEWVYLSSRRMTFAVVVDADETIRRAPPIARKFIGQPLEHLRRWLERQGGLRELRLP